MSSQKRSKLEEDWRNGLIEELAKDLWLGYKRWMIETHNVFVNDWDDPEMGERILAIKESVRMAAKAITDSQERNGIYLKEL